MKTQWRDNQNKALYVLAVVSEALSFSCLKGKMAVAISALERKRNRAACVKVIWKCKHTVQYYCWPSLLRSGWAGGGNVKDMGEFYGG